MKRSPMLKRKHSILLPEVVNILKTIYLALLLHVIVNQVKQDEHMHIVELSGGMALPAAMHLCNYIIAR